MVDATKTIAVDSTEVPEGSLALLCEYRIMQATLFKKPGQNPASEKIIRLKGCVGATVHTTGRIWTGPAGGRWVELDSVVEKPGWMLVEGPGFGVLGHILEKIDSDDEQPLVLSAVRPNFTTFEGVREWKEFVVSPNAFVSEAKMWIAILFGLNPKLLILSRPLEGLRGPAAQNKQIDGDSMGKRTYYLSPEDILEDSMTFRQAGFQDCDEVQYAYSGSLDEAVEGKEPSWIGNLTNSQPTRPGRRAGLTSIDDLDRKHPGLRDHFQVLDLPGSLVQDDIKRHYRRLALECHPDKHPEDVEAATKKFQEITASYEVIRTQLRL